MSKRIVVGLDGSEYCKKAIQYACRRANNFDGTVVGVGVVDLPGIERAASGAGIGASHYAKHSREQLTKKAETEVEKLLAEFEETCRTASVAFEMEQRAGNPEEKILDAALSADLIVVGTRTFYHFETPEAPGHAQAKLVQAGICPVLAVPDTLELPFVHLTFPYDSSPGAARAMRNLLALTSEYPIDYQVMLLRVEDNPEEGRKALERPAQYLRAYAYDVELKVEPGDPCQVVRDIAHQRLPGLVVLGASGRGMLSKLLFGSVTRTLIEDGKIPLFISA